MINKSIKARIPDKNLENNPHIRRSLIQIGKVRGEAGEMMKRVRNGEINDKELKGWIKKDWKKTLEARDEKYLTREDIILINKLFGDEFQTPFGLGGNSSNLDYALTLKNPYNISREILRGHPFIDGNKRTSLMVYLLLTTTKSFEEILGDYYDIFKSLAK